MQRVSVRERDDVSGDDEDREEIHERRSKTLDDIIDEYARSE